jgi:zinc and cadmium transporter
LNFATALAAIASGVLGYFFLPYIAGATFFLVPFAAGGFIYIAAVDLVPLLHREPDTKKTALSFAFLLLGILFLYGLRVLGAG